MNSAGQRSTVSRFLFSIGFGLGSIEALLTGKANAPTPREESAVTKLDASPHEPLAAADSSAPSECGAIAAMAGGFALRLLLRPRPVNWPRAIFAGVAGTACADLTSALLVRFENEADAADSPPWCNDPAEIIARYLSGVARAAAFGAIVYPRVPGLPMTRGLLFGLVDAASAEAGGAIELLKDLAPGLRLPLANLHSPLEAQGPLPHLAYGLGVGLIYRGKRMRR